MAPGKQVFGQTIQKRSNNGGNNYRRQFGGSTYRGGAGSDAATAKTSTATANEKAEYRRMRQAKGEALDVRFGMDRFSLDSHHESPAKSTSAHHKVAHDAKRTRERRGWLFNILTTTVRWIDFLFKLDS